MHTVYKYPLGKHSITEHAVARCVAAQGNDIYVWVELDTEAKDKIEVEFIAVPTGGKVPKDCSYIGTVHSMSGWMVFHVFWRVIKK
jgi:hypothetical protein